jgi:ubiquinone/menaquinone biosynthesis C-methylase UbiE
VKNNIRLEKAHNFFIRVVESHQSALKKKHAWLDGIRNMVESRSYVNGIFEDVVFVADNVSGKRILDLGTGSGYVALLLAELGYHVDGIDIKGYKEEGNEGAHDTMEFDQKLLWPSLEKEYSGLNLCHYNKKMPFPDNTFDCVVAYAVLEHIPSSHQSYVLKEVRRVLKKNGYLFISRLPRKFSYVEFMAGSLGIPHHDQLYSYSDIKCLLRKHGFRITSKSITDLFPAYPSKITNPLFPITKFMEKILLYTPIRYIGHDFRILCRKVGSNNDGKHKND